jgi:hypothetical protein
MTLSTYLGLPLLDWPADMSDPGLDLEIKAAKVRLDNGAGPIKDDAPYEPRPRTARRLRYVLDSREAMLDARDFLRDVAQGRWKSFWVPTWAQDLQLAADVDGAATALAITRLLFTPLYAGTGLGREHIAAFPFVSGTGPVLTPRKITDVTTLDDATEQLTLSSALGNDLTTDDLLSFLLLCRLDDDRLLFAWESMESGVLELPVIDLPRETP